MKPLLPGQPVTQKGDRPSQELVEIIDRIVKANANGQLVARVTFNGTGTVAIQSAGNVASITDLGVGNYRINFAKPMEDTAYTVVANCSQTGGAAVTQWVRLGTRTTTGIEVFVLDQTGTARDSDSVNVAVFR